MSIPSGYQVDAHHGFMLHGGHGCQAHKPQCGLCSVSACCDFKPKTPAP